MCEKVYHVQAQFAILTKLIYGFNVAKSKFQQLNFVEIDKLILKFI